MRKKGFTIDKMGRNNPPVKKENAPSEADIERLKKQGMKPRKEQKDLLLLCMRVLVLLKRRQKNLVCLWCIEKSL